MAINKFGQVTEYVFYLFLQKISCLLTYVYICQRRAYNQQELLIHETPLNFVNNGVKPKL